MDSRHCQLEEKDMGRNPFPCIIVFTCGIPLCFRCCIQVIHPSDAVQLYSGTPPQALVNGIEVIVMAGLVKSI